MVWMRRTIGAVAIALLLAVALAEAAGTVTVTTASGGAGRTKYSMAWTASNPGGAVSANAVTVKGGSLYALEIVPGTAGDQPTDQYDLTLLDDQGVDVLNGAGANLSNSAGSIIVFDPPLPFAPGTLTPTIANAGNGKKGTLILIAG